MKVFVINLDQNKERLAFVHAQLSRLGMSYERFSGVYGKGFTKEERERVSSPLRSYLCSGHVIGGGELGCALSHIGVYRQIIADQLPYALVMEDDVILSEKFPEVVEYAERKLCVQRPQVVLFSNWGGVDVGGRGFEVVRLRRGVCTDAYLITRTAAELICRANTPVMCAADAWGRWVRRHGLELYRAFPTTVSQDIDAFQSNIRPANVDPRALLGKGGTNRRGVSWLVFKMRRALEKSLDYILYLITGR